MSGINNDRKFLKQLNETVEGLGQVSRAFNRFTLSKERLEKGVDVFVADVIAFKLDEAMRKFIAANNLQVSEEDGVVFKFKTTAGKPLFSFKKGMIHVEPGLSTSEEAQVRKNVHALLYMSYGKNVDWFNLRADLFTEEEQQRLAAMNTVGREDKLTKKPIEIDDTEALLASWKKLAEADREQLKNLWAEDEEKLGKTPISNAVVVCTGRSYNDAQDCSSIKFDDSGRLLVLVGKRFESGKYCFPGGMGAGYDTTLNEFIQEVYGKALFLEGNIADSINSLNSVQAISETLQKAIDLKDRSGKPVLPARLSDALTKVIEKINLSGDLQPDQLSKAIGEALAQVASEYKTASGDKQAQHELYNDLQIVLIKNLCPKKYAECIEIFKDCKKTKKPQAVGADQRTNRENGTMYTTVNTITEAELNKLKGILGKIPEHLDRDMEIGSVTYVDLAKVLENDFTEHGGLCLEHSIQWALTQENKAKITPETLNQFVEIAQKKSQGFKKLLENAIPDQKAFLSDALAKTIKLETKLLELKKQKFGLSVNEKKQLHILKSAIKNPGGNGMTPMHYAAENGQLDAVDKFIKSGADVNAPDKDGFTPLHMAALKGHADVVQALIKAGAKVNAVATNGGWTPLHLAVREGNAALVDTLLKAGADVSMKQKTRTVVDIAALSNNQSVNQYLIQAAVKQDQPDIVKAFESLNLPFEAKQLLFFAAESHSPKVVKILREAQGKIEIPQDNPNKSLLEYLQQSLDTLGKRHEEREKQWAKTAVKNVLFLTSDVAKNTDSMDKFLVFEALREKVHAAENEVNLKEVVKELAQDDGVKDNPFFKRLKAAVDSGELSVKDKAKGSLHVSHHLPGLMKFVEKQSKQPQSKPNPSSTV